MRTLQITAPPAPELTLPPAPEPVYDLDSPTSITVVVNKQRALNPIDWAPDDLVMPEGIPNVWGHPLRAEASAALQQMYAAASEAGLPFTITSGYREYALQNGIYDGLVAEGGAGDAWAGHAAGDEAEQRVHRLHAGRRHPGRDFAAELLESIGELGGGQQAEQAVAEG